MLAMNEDKPVSRFKSPIEVFDYYQPRRIAFGACSVLIAVAGCIGLMYPGSEQETVPRLRAAKAQLEQVRQIHDQNRLSNQIYPPEIRSAIMQSLPEQSEKQMKSLDNAVQLAEQEFYIASEEADKSKQRMNNYKVLGLFGLALAALSVPFNPYVVQETREYKKFRKKFQFKPFQNRTVSGFCQRLLFVLVLANVLRRMA